MAAPAEKTIHDLSGRWILVCLPNDFWVVSSSNTAQNKSISDNSEPVLALQGIGFLTRKGIGLASISLDINQYTAPPKPPSTATDVVTHIDITQTASGLKSTQEDRCIDDFFRGHADWLFGKVRGKSSWVSLEEIDDEFLKTGWLVEGDGKLLKSYVESQDDDWIATQIWGFEMVEGERRYTRHVVVTKKDQRVQIRMVYDYVPSE